jgi:dUTP pyrophosphatase
MLKYLLSEAAKNAGIKFIAPRTGDAGFDIQVLENSSIEAKGFGLLKTGLHLAIPVGYVGLVRDRSSVALRGGVVSAGVIDASYRGEVKIAMHNMSNEPLEFKAGDKIAQILIIEHLKGEDSAEVNSIEELGDTARGAGGFGSTGK